MILQKEMVLLKGTAYKFKTAPVDPIDPFIGRYIILNFPQQSYSVSSKDPLQNAKTVYVTFKNNKAGFAEIDQVTASAPERTDYLSTTISTLDVNKDSVSIFIQYPFNRFYMEESKAPEAERIYGTELADSSSNVYALVSIYKGDAAIKNVYINDTTITDMLKRRSVIMGD